MNEVLISVEDINNIENDILDESELWEEDEKTAMLKCAYICGVHDMANEIRRRIKER